MIITHDISWPECLSNQLFPAIKKGWKDRKEKIHFFWGLGSNNLKEIEDVKRDGDEWWYVDVGYITEQITRYPTPKINDYDKTYFRIVKGNMHMTSGKPGDGSRHTKLLQQGIDAEFKGWNTGECKHILLAPSSQTVCGYVHNLSQEDWIKQSTSEIKCYTDRTITMRNKPRPNNKWWGTDIKDVCYYVSGRLEDINERRMPAREDMTMWLRSVANNQFTLQEIEDGTAYKVLNA